jgi:hypothetical protein
VGAAGHRLQLLAGRGRAYGSSGHTSLLLMCRVGRTPLVLALVDTPAAMLMAGPCVALALLEGPEVVVVLPMSCRLLLLPAPGLVGELALQADAQPSLLQASSA